MNAPQTPPPAPPVTYWQPPSSDLPEFPGLRQLRARLVALVAALVIQATIAACDVLPRLPGSHTTAFWAQFALLEFVAAVVISLAFGPGVGLRDLPAIIWVVLGVAFVVVPAAAVLLGGVEAFNTAAAHGPATALASELATGFFATIFFGLPMIALAAPGPRAAHTEAVR